MADKVCASAEGAKPPLWGPWWWWWWWWWWWGCKSKLSQQL